MKLRTLLSLLLLALLVLAACTRTSAPTPGTIPPQLDLDPTGSFVAGQIIVGYEESSSAEAVAASIGATVLRDWHQINAAVLDLPDGVTLAKAASLLKGSQGVRYSEPRQVFERDPVSTSGGSATQGLETLQDTIEDAQFGLQWQHRQVNSEAAWAQGITGAGIRIGIHDDNIDHRHPDLVDNMFYPGYNGFTDELIQPDTPHDGGGTHGTSVAGKAAATANAIGGRGVAYGASIVPLSISDFGEQTLDTNAIVSAALFAVDGPDGFSPIFSPDQDTDSAPGANAYVHIVNMSWGSAAYSQLVKDTMDYMLLHGIVGVTSAGNTPTLSMASPAWYPGLITVAATNPRDERTEFSNRGDHIDVAAPGQNTWVTQTRSCVLNTPDGSSCEGSEVDYRFFGGTSSASPATAGVAALVMEALAERDADGNITAVPTPAQVRRILSDTAFQPDGDVFNDNLGYGIVDAGAAVSRALELDLGTAEAGGSLVVDAVLASNTDIGLGQVGLSLIPLGGDGPTKYTQSADGSFWAEGRALFLEVDAGSYLLLASGPHTATTGIEAVTGSAVVTLPEGDVFGVTIPLDATLFDDLNEPNDDLATATGVSVGTTTTASLYNPEAETDVDVYAFAVTAERAYRVNLETLAGSFDTFLSIVDADGNVIASNDDNQADTTDSLVDFVAPTTGIVYAVVEEFFGDQAPGFIYAIDIASPIIEELEPNGSASVSGTTISNVDFAAAQSVALGSAINASISTETDTDIFAVNVSAGTTLVADVEAFESSEPDTMIGIYDEAGTQVAFNDDFTGRESRVSYTAETDGILYVVVVSWDVATTGDYGLTLTRERDPEAVATGFLRVLHGSPDAPDVDVLVDSLEVLGDVPYKTGSAYLDVEQGTRNIQVTAAGDASAVVIDANVEIVADSFYTVIAANTLGNIEPLVLEDDRSDPAAGNLKVRVVHGSPSAGNVDIYVTAPEATLADVAPTVADVAFGANSGYLEVPAGDYRIRATAVGDAEAVYDSGIVSLSEGLILTTVALDNDAAEGASPVTVVALTGDSAQPSFEIPDYREPESTNDTPDDATSIAPGFFTGAINPAGDVDFYSFTLDTGTLVTFDIDAEALGSDLDSFIILYDADGEELNFNDDANESLDSFLGFYLPAGTYFFSVEGSSGGPDNFYTLAFNEEAITDAVFEATAGTFAGNSNSPTIDAFEGNVVTLSARTGAGDVLDYPALVNITNPVGGEFPFAYFPTFGNVVNVAIGDVSESLESLATPTERLASYRRGDSAQVDPATSLVQYTPSGSGLGTLAAVGGSFAFELPTGTVTRDVDADVVLDVPTVETVDANEDGTEFTVGFVEPEGATSFEATVFGRNTGFSGDAVVDASPATVTITPGLSGTEPYVVDVLAGDSGTLGVPLPDAPLNLSAYLFYSDFSE